MTGFRYVAFAAALGLNACSLDVDTSGKTKTDKAEQAKACAAAETAANRAEGAYVAAAVAARDATPDSRAAATNDAERARAILDATAAHKLSACAS